MIAEPLERRTLLSGLTQDVGVLNGRFYKQHTVLTMQESGSAVVGRIEIRNAGTRAAGVDRVLRNILVQIPTDKIAYYVAVPDFTDPDTARLAAQ